MSPATPDLAERVRQHLERLIAWLEQAIPVLDRLPEDEAADETPAAETLRAQGAALDHLLREHEALRREWEAHPTADSQARAAVGILSERAEQRVAAWQARHDAARERLAHGLKDARDALAALGRDRALAKRLRLDEDVPRHLDHQA